MRPEGREVGPRRSCYIEAPCLLSRSLDGGSAKTMSMRWLRQRAHQVAKSMALRIPAVRGTFNEVQRYRDEVQGYRHLFRFAPPGHFYSPLPSPEELERDAPRLFGAPPRAIPGIDLNESAQLALL